MAKSIEFIWDKDLIERDYSIVDKDEAVKLSIKYFKNNYSSVILEAGSGNGRVVKYLTDLGYKHVEGLELNSEIVELLNNKFKYLSIYQGDLITFKFDKKYDFIMSFGLVEHFVEGFEIPINKFYEIINDNGKIILTVPCFNFYRRLRFYLSLLNPKNINRKKNLPGKDGFLYHVGPLYGNFFEYYTTSKEFDKICIGCGFSILERKPISYEYGIYQVFGNRIGIYGEGEIRLNKLGRILNSFFKVIPYFHNHMYAVVLEKK